MMPITEELLTAYALNEVDEAERAAVEAHLKEHERDRHTVEEIRAAAGALTNELKSEKAPGLTDAQREAIASAASAPNRVPARNPFRMTRSTWLAIAASVMLVAGVVAIVLSTSKPSPSAAACKAFAEAEEINRRTDYDMDGVLEYSQTMQGEKSLLKPPPSSTSSATGKVSDGLAESSFDASLRMLADDKKTPGDGSWNSKWSYNPQTPPASGELQRGITPRDGGINLNDVLNQPPADLRKPNSAPAPKPTFTISNNGKIFQHDSSANTHQRAFNPDRTWADADESAAWNKKTPDPSKVEDLRRHPGDLALVDKTFGGAEGPASAASPKAGYVFLVQTDQSKTATGKARTYIVTGDMTLGYACSAVPGSYDGTGRDTFVIANNGTIFQKDKIGQIKKVSEDGKKTAVEVLTKAVKTAAPAEQKELQNVLTLVTTAPEGPNTEAYDPIQENLFLNALQNPLSTFSSDVDTASYSNVRRMLLNRQVPSPDAVRIEEMINYFRYDYATPTDEHPFAVHMEAAQCPWEPEHRLLRIGIKGREVDSDKRPPTNLVFLLDCSGSMADANKLPLVKSSMKLLLGKLNETDRVAIVTYSNSATTRLESTSAKDEATIRAAIDELSASGSTNGAGGIQLAYQIAEKNFIKGGANRVILCTDGDFNVGVTSQGDLVRLIEEKRKNGVYLSILGYGMGNYKDGTLEKIAGKGNGNYAYIDDLKESNKVLVEQASGTLLTIAKDVKLQVEFNPAQVSAYRLIGYEDRVMAHEDFNDDKKDAGDIGAGHTVTTLYEIVPVGKKIEMPKVDPLKYQSYSSLTESAYTDEVATLKLRYKQPDGDTSKLIELAVKDSGNRYAKASADFKFAAAVASFGMLLRGSQHKGNATFDSVVELATEAKGDDKSGYRAEFIELVKTAKALKK
jgi:Ca-activated chloride channel family protein